MNTFLKRKSDIKMNKVNIRGDEVAFIFLSLIFFIFLVFSSFRILPIGKLFDDFVFTFFFGWTKYLVYLLLFILVIPVFFNRYFKVKFSFLVAIVAVLLLLSWLLQNIVLIVTNHRDIWFNMYHFHISMMQDYFDNFLDNSIIKNYHGFFVAPISFDDLKVTSFFPSYAVGGLISNLCICLLSYPFILNVVIFLLISLIILPWFFFNRPLLIVGNIFKLVALPTRHFFNDVTEAHKDNPIIINNNLSSSKKTSLVHILQQHADTRNRLTASIVSENDPTIPITPQVILPQPQNIPQVSLAQEQVKPEILFPIKDQDAKFFSENSNLTPFGFGEFNNNLTYKQKEVANIIEETTTLKVLEPKNLLVNSLAVDKIINQALDSAPIAFTPEEVVNNKKYVLPQLKPVNLQTSNFKIMENESYAVKNKTQINQLFQEFGIQSKVENYHIGTTVTKYEISIVSGMRVNKITSLEDELKLALANNNIRIEAPIPGKSLIGIEVANKHIVPVNIQEQINQLHKVTNDNKTLLISIGKTTTGQYLFHSLQDMPHLLIAGSTGAGKSVFINDLLISILLQYQPHEVKLLLIDPKWVELTMYNDIAHLLAPVITEPNKVAPALQVVILEMMRRYKLFANSACRNIDSYNKKITDQIQKLPYYVVVIDELADLMIQNGKEVEEGIIRITQMGRAAGIHLIVATQRPSTDVITGVIKNNIPSKIAFQVASFVDSRTIIDSAGAEKLLGKGDMLFLTPGNNGPIRVQAPWISEEEVIDIIEFIKTQVPVSYDDNFINAIDKIDEKKKI